MVTETLYSTALTNANATPRVPNSSFTEGGILRTSRGSVTVTSGKTTGSIYHLVELPAHARVVSVRLNNPAGSASSAFDFGVYRTVADGAAVCDADLFGSAVACTNANVDLDITGESTVNTNALREQPLWQAAGLSTNPGGLLSIAATNTATNAAAFSIGIEVQWTI